MVYLCKLCDVTLKEKKKEKKNMISEEIVNDNRDRIGSLFHDLREIKRN